jgi:hypothetical protein
LSIELGCDECVRKKFICASWGFILSKKFIASMKMKDPMKEFNKKSKQKDRKKLFRLKINNIEM